MLPTLDCKLDFLCFDEDERACAHLRLDALAGVAIPPRDGVYREVALFSLPEQTLVRYGLCRACFELVEAILPKAL